VATGDDRVVSPVTGARKVLTSGSCLLERESGRQGARASAADGWGRLAAAEGREAQARGSWVAWAVRGGEKRGRAGEREGVWARNGLAEGGIFSFFFFYFYFLFLFPISIYFISFSFEQIIS
jgi:hypothetical protein